MASTTTAAELRGLGAEALEDKLREAKEELFNLRFQNATGQLDNSARIKQTKKDIARLLGALRAHEIKAAEKGEA